jgi:hypothetical protein
MRRLFPITAFVRAGIQFLFFFLIVLRAAAQPAPYPDSPVIRSIQFDWTSHVRLASGSDNWPVTWAGDGNQYTVWGDGGGFGGTNSIGRSSLGVARIAGDWHDFKPANVWGGYKPEHAHDVTGKSYGIVCIDNVLYMWVGMFETKSDPFREVKLAYSTDLGATWKFCPWAFTREEGVMMPTVCNYGKNYEGATDEYLYTYLIRFRSYEGPDDYPDKVDWLNCQKPGTIDLARVPKGKLLDRQAYTFFSGTDGGMPVWTSDIDKRQPVFEDTAGVGWCMNVSYNAGLKRYLLTTEHTETHRGNIGIFDAPTPWGPWTTVCYQQNWGEGHFPLNTFFWNFSNKWLSGDGKTFSLIFTGRKENDSFNVIRGEFITSN